MSGPARPAIAVVLAAGVLLLAGALRLPGISTPSIEQRETQSGLLARRWSVDREALPAWKRDVLATVDREIRPIEPPLLEGITALGWRLTGSDAFWLPRLLSVLAWLAGGACLWAIGRRAAGEAGALVALALYCAWPYGVWHSRLFMPDALLVAAILAAALTALRHRETPTTGRFAAAVAAAALATLVKPGVGLLPVLGAFVGLAVAEQGVGVMLRDRRTWAYVTGAVVPTLLYVVWGTVLTDVIWDGADDARVTPQRLLETGFWSDWWSMVSYLLTMPQPQTWLALAPLVLGVAGIALAPRGRPRALLLGQLGGYVAFAAVYATYVSTHPYYSLILIPLLSLGIGVVAARMLERVKGRVARAALAVAFAAVLIVAAQRALSVTTAPAANERIAAYGRIGEATGHTVRSIIVDDELGTPAMYWGWIATRGWETDYASVPPPWLEPEEADYLIVVEPAERADDANIARYVRDLPVVARDPWFVVYRLP